VKLERGVIVEAIAANAWLISARMPAGEQLRVQMNCPAAGLRSSSDAVAERMISRRIDGSRDDIRTDAQQRLNVGARIALPQVQLLTRTKAPAVPMVTK